MKLILSSSLRLREEHLRKKRFKDLRIRWNIFQLERIHYQGYFSFTLHTYFVKDDKSNGEEETSRNLEVIESDTTVRLSTASLTSPININ